MALLNMLDENAPPGTVGHLTANAVVMGNGDWQIVNPTSLASLIQLRDTGVIDLHGTQTAGKADWLSMLRIDAPKNNVSIGADKTSVDIKGTLNLSKLKLTGLSAPPAGTDTNYVRIDKDGNLYKQD